MVRFAFAFAFASVIDDRSIFLFSLNLWQASGWVGKRGKTMHRCLWLVG